MNILTFVGPNNISANYGWFHVYSFTMFLGIAVSILVSWYKLYRHQIPTEGMSIAVVFIIPLSLFGASFLGKDDPQNPMSFWNKLEFWHGGLSIHGGVLFGVLTGLIIFSFISRKTNVSLWVYADCIIPNILLGQVIGRWGNFFNHELLGEIVGYGSLNGGANHIPAISWLPAFIRDNCFKLTGGTSPEMINGLVVFRAPIFLYESMGNFSLWLILTFLLPKVFLWTSKKKPWKLYKEKYQFATKNNELGKNNNFFQNFVTNIKIKRQAWKVEFYEKHLDELVIKNIDHNYTANKGKSQIKAYLKRSSDLYSANSNGYSVMNVGVQTWFYFFGWNFIRFFLETQRTNPADLFIINRRELDYAVLISLFVISLVITILSQFVFPKMFRKTGWTYEKQY